MIYCFKCPECGYRVETTQREPAPWCDRNEDGPEMIRDYKAEAVGVDRFALKTWGSRSTRREPEGTGEVSYV